MERNFSVGAWFVMPDNNKLIFDGKDYLIEPLAMDVLSYFANNPHKVLSRNELVDKVWNGRIVGDHAVYRIINQLRKILSEDTENVYIETIRKKGYQLRQDVQWGKLTSSVETRFDYTDIVKTTQPSLTESTPDSAFQTNLTVTPKESRDYELALGDRAASKVGKILQVRHFSSRRTLYAFALLLSVPLIWYLIQSFDRYLDYQAMRSFKVIKPFSVIIGEEKDPRFSPDGNHIVYSHRAKPDRYFNIYLQGLVGESPVKITQSEGDNFSPTWSPDGKEIAIIRRQNGRCEIMKIEVLSALTTPEKITDCNSLRLLPEVIWATNDSIYFTDSYSDVDPFRIYQYSIKTGKRSQLTNPEVGKSKGDIHIALSNHEKTIAFTRDLDWGNTQVNLLDLETRKITHLFLLSGWRKALAWSHDDEYLYYIDKEDNIRAYSIEHGFHKLVLENSETVNSVSGHPTKDILTIMTGENGIDIWGMSLDPNSRQFKHEYMVIESSEMDLYPEFAQGDSDTIAFMSLRSGRAQIWIHLKDGREYQLSQFDDNRNIQRLRWSPDGQFVLSSSANRLYRINVNTREYQAIWESPNPSRIEAPSWSTDGLSVFFSSDIDGDWQIYKIGLESAAEPLVITQNGGYAAMESAEGSLFYYKYHQDGIWEWLPKSEEEIRRVDDTNVFAYDSLYPVQGGFYYISIIKTSHPDLIKQSKKAEN